MFNNYLLKIRVFIKMEEQNLMKFVLVRYHDYTKFGWYNEILNNDNSIQSMDQLIQIQFIRGV